MSVTPVLRSSPSSVSGRTRKGGIPFDHTWGYLCRVDDGRLSYFGAYFNPAEALEAAGLEEQRASRRAAPSARGGPRLAARFLPSTPFI
jgi:hypothetical protein